MARFDLPPCSDARSRLCLRASRDRLGPPRPSRASPQRTFALDRRGQRARPSERQTARAAIRACMSMSLNSPRTGAIRPSAHWERMRRFLMPSHRWRDFPSHSKTTANSSSTPAFGPAVYWRNSRTKTCCGFVSRSLTTQACSRVL